jgi:hypothetical protein
VQRAGAGELGEARHQVVAVDERDPGSETEAVGDLVDGGGAAAGVEATGVGQLFDEGIDGI